MVDAIQNMLHSQNINPFRYPPD